MANPVTAFAHRPHHVVQRVIRVARGDGHDLVVGLVHGRAWQVVHGGVDDAKVFLFAGLQVQHLGQADAGIAHQ